MSTASGDTIDSPGSSAFSAGIDGGTPADGVIGTSSLSRTIGMFYGQKKILVQLNG
jgi:hypothetical protein